MRYSSWIGATRSHDGVSKKSSKNGILWLLKLPRRKRHLKRNCRRNVNRSDDLENRLEELRLVTHTMRPMDIGTPGAPRASTPTPRTPGSIGSNSFFLSPAANLAIKLQKGGRSYTEIMTMSKSTKNSSPRKKRLANSNQPLLKF